MKSMTAERTTLRLASLLLVVAWIGIFGSSGALAQQADTTAAVKARYEKLLAEYSRIVLHPSKTSPSAVSFSLKNKMVSKELRALLLKDEACAKKSGGMCNLDFDFLFNAQDYCKPLKILGVFQKGNTYTMTVSNGFEACDKQGYYKPYAFTLIDESGTWVIDDALYSMKDDNGKVINVTLKDILRGKH